MTRSNSAKSKKIMAVYFKKEKPCKISFTRLFKNIRFCFSGCYRLWFDKMPYSHSLTSFFPQLLFTLFLANFREISLVLLRFSLYSLCSQPVWYCFGIKVWYQFSEKTGGEKIRYSFWVIDTWLCHTVQLALMFEYKGGCKGRASSWSNYIIAHLLR